MSDQPPIQPEGSTYAGTAAASTSDQTPVVDSAQEIGSAQASTTLATNDNAPSGTTAGASGPTSGSGSSSSDAAAIRAQVEKEQALKDAQRRVRALEEEVSRMKGDKVAVEGERDAAVQSTNQLRTQLSSLQSAHHKSASELSVLQTRIEIVEREKKELLEETERQQDRSTRTNQELYTLRAQKGESAQKIAHLDVELSEMRLKAESAKFNENRAQDAVVAARAEILRMGKVTADVEERFGKYRAEKQSQYSSLQTEHDITLSRLTTAESSYQALQRSYNDQSARLATAHADINDLTSSAASRKAASQTEVARLVEENRILTKRAEETREVVAEREAELEQLTAAYNEASETAEARIKTEERRRKEAEKKAAELKQTVDRLALAAGEGDNLSATAAVAQELKSQGKSYTEFFRDYTLQELRLQEAEEEVQRLTGVLDDIREDIAEKKPLLNEQAQEHAAAIDRANKLSAEIALVIAARDAYADTISSLRAEAAHNSEEVTSLQSITNDLSRQVQNLLRQLAIRDDPSLANTPLDAPNGVDATEDVITERFTEFKSLRNLQEQNVKLLKLTRVLIGRLEQRDIKRTMAEDDEVDTVHSLEEAAETIEKLHTQLLDAQKRIHETTRERDMFSKLLARGEGLKYTSGASRLEDEILPGSGSGSGNGSAATIAGAAGSSAVQAQVVQANQEIIEALRAEIAGIRSKAEEEVKGVRDELKERMKAVGEAEVGRAKAEARAGMLQEQARSLQDMGNLEKQAKAGLETQIRQVQVSLQSAQNEARQSREQAALKQAEADRLRTDVAVLRAEKEQWTATRGIESVMELTKQSTEARLQADFRTVQAERTRLTSLIENLNGVSTENDRSRGEERKRLETRVEELQRESTELRSQLSTATEAQIAASAKLTEAEAAHTSAIAALNEKITAHEAEIARAKTAGLSWRRQHNTLKETEIPALRAQITEAQTALENKEGEMTALHKQVGEAKREKEGLEGRLKDVNAQLETVKRSEGLKEQTVQRLQSELSRKNGGAADTAALQTEKQKLQARVTELEGELATAKAAVPAAPAAATAGTGDAAEKEEKLQKLQDEVASWTKKYDEGVIKVNRANSSMKNRITELLTEKGTLTARIAELEEQIQNQPVAAGDAGASSTDATAGTTEVKSETVDQAAIDKAVKAAVSAKEFELNVAHAKALSDAKSAAASSTSSPAAPAADNNSEAIKAAVSAKETELNTAFDTRLAAAVSEARAPLAALEEEKKQLQIKIEALEEKIKALERQGRTAEISRKTLERTSAANTVVLAAIKAELEKKGIKLDTTIPAAVGTKPAVPATAPANAAATGSGAGSGSGSGSAPPTGPAVAATPTSATPAGAAAPAGAQPPTGPAVTRSASVKGKGAVARPGGPGRGVLASVNATLAQAGSSTSQAQKRPAPEEGEIPEAEPSASTASPTTASVTTAASSEAGAGAGAGAGDVLARLQGQAQGQTGEATRGGRAIKRPRGAGRGGARGGATAGAAGAAAGRRPSAGNSSNNAGAGQGGGQPPASGGDGASS